MLILQLGRDANYQTLLKRTDKYKRMQVLINAETMEDLQKGIAMVIWLLMRYRLQLLETLFFIFIYSSSKTNLNIFIFIYSVVSNNN
jgi:hypothetical protein